MMKQLITLCMAVFACTFSQGQQILQICSVAPASTTSGISSFSVSYTPYGNSLTPKGDLKILVISAGFGTPWDNYACGGWATGSTSLPTWFSDKSLFYNSNSDFTTYASTTNNSNISRFYYEMSKETFRFIADYYPTRINIDPAGASGWAELNQRVLDKMKLNDPTFNWSNYDKRSNQPGYQFDNSTLSTDNKPDFVVIVYRYSGGFSTQPVAGMNSWAGSSGGFSQLPITNQSTFQYNGYSFNAVSGFTFCAGDVGPTELFVHEMAHSIFDSPHFTQVNGVAGYYYYAQAAGWGMMQLGSGAFASATGWERWYLDWIGISANGVSSNLESKLDLVSGGEYTLRDFIKYGDVVRLKIPNGTSDNQYLWLENHQGTSIYDNRLWVNDGCGNPFPNSPRGLVAYIESINDDKSAPIDFWNSPKAANGIKYIHPAGRFDYSLEASNIPCNLWNNTIYNINEGNANPISGQSRAEGIRTDLNTDNLIYYHKNANGAPSGTPRNEWHWLNKRNNAFTYDAFGGGMAFAIGQKFGMGTNPALTNRPKFEGASNLDAISPYILNGITITVIQQNPNGDIKISVKYDDTSIDSDLRWAGPINLPNITGNSSADVILKRGKNIYIDKSGTPDRMNALTGSFANPVEKFINPTKFTALNSSYFLQEPNSNIIVKNGSSFILKSGARLELQDGASFVVKKGSYLTVESGATLVLSGSSRIEIECNGSLNVMSGAIIQLQNSNSAINVHSGALLPGLTNFSSVVSGSGIVNYSSTFSVNPLMIQNTTYTTDNVIAAKSIETQSNVKVNSPSYVVYTAEGGVILGPSFEVKPNSSFRVDVTPNNCY